jgi:hypothetical protein
MLASSERTFPKEARSFPEELPVLVQSTRDSLLLLLSAQELSLSFPTYLTNRYFKPPLKNGGIFFNTAGVS